MLRRGNRRRRRLRFSGSGHALLHGLAHLVHHAAYLLAHGCAHHHAGHHPGRIHVAVAATEVHAAHLTDVLHAGLEHLCLLVDAVGIDIGRFAAELGLSGGLFGLQVLGELGLFPHAGRCVAHMLHLHLGHFLGRLVADVGVGAHCLTLNLKAEQRGLLIFEVIQLGLVFRQALEFLIAVTVFVVPDFFNEYIAGEDAETLHNALLHTGKDVMAHFPDKLVEVHNEDAGVLWRIGDNLLDFLG